MIRFLLFLPMLTVLFGLRTPGSDCRKCEGTHRLHCSKHVRGDPAWEEGVLFCSHADLCGTCQGTGWVDCPKCENELADAELARARALRAEARERVAFVDEAMERNVAKIETEHFLVVFEIESLKVGRKRLKAHELHHLYAQRMEELFALYLETLGADASEFERKMRVFVWAFDFDQEEGSLRFCQQSGRAGVRLHGSEPAYSVCGSKRFFPKDEDLHRNLAHNVPQILFSHQRPAGWVGNRKGGWIEEGLAHWFEDRLFERCANFCYEEQATTAGMRTGNFKLFARKLVAGEEAPPIATVLAQNSDTLTGDMRVVSMSYVDYLIEQDGSKVGELGKRLRAGETSRDALREVFELSPLELERRWKAWVLETYPTR